ncbi:septum formation initiator family protein [Lentisalinibacter salinarum]|uniref:septum formation initiator family protein n=1 Tax=Lentisalinibacter salinarum TaxID=2992239 RepID=UPI0038666A96
MRWFLALLLFLFLGLQADLWLSEDGYRKTRELRRAVAEAREENEALAARNAALEAEVQNLKTGSEAAEERARSDLGLIGPRETFYQVVPAD